MASSSGVRYPTRLLLPALRAHLLALAALRPPGEGLSLGEDASFGCLVTRRCACFDDADAFEIASGALAADGDDAPDADADGGVGRSLVREVLELRYAQIGDDGAVVSGLGDALRTARCAFGASLCCPPPPPLEPRSQVEPRSQARRGERRCEPCEPPPPLEPRSVQIVRAHARQLRRQIASLPSRGEALSPAIWRMEIGSLLEDVAYAALGTAEFVEPLLRWVALPPSRSARSASSNSALEAAGLGGPACDDARLGQRG